MLFIALISIFILAAAKNKNHDLSLSTDIGQFPWCLYKNVLVLICGE